jgi:acetyltransferase-like isoleucine patch superfamily enzyme
MNRIFGSLLNRLAFHCPGGYRIRPRLQRWRGVDVGRNVWIGLHVYIDDVHPGALSVGDNTTVGIGTTILTHSYWGPRQAHSNGKVVIERDVFIGPHCVILPNVRIGEGAVIKAGTVVTRNVPPRTFWGSPPAEALGQVTVSLTAEHGYVEFLRGMKAARRGQRVAAGE